MKTIKCGLCGKEFFENEYAEYAAHVQKCAAECSMRAKTEEMKKINQELEEVKRAKVCYEGLRDAFKEKYPDIYKANFKDEKVCNCKKDNKNPSLYNSDSKGKHTNFDEDFLDFLLNKILQTN